MKKIINDPKDVLAEMTSGLVGAYPEKLEQIPDTFVIKRKVNAQQVALVSGGGSGHEPAHAGFVGDGMLSAAVCGQVFTSPTPDQIFAAIQATNEGKGVLLIVKNYSGDVMNFEMAQDMADLEDISVGFVLVDDDIAVEDSTYTQGRRGVAGTVLVHKILGAWAKNGASVEQLETAGKELVEKIKTIGVALSGATVPEVGKPGFELAEDEIEFGVGIHGEPGYRREKSKSSKEMAKEIVEKLKAEFQWEKGDSYGVLVNGMGATPLMEQYIFFNDVKAILEEEGVAISFSKVGNYMTSIDMAGLSLTMIQTDQAILDALNMPVDTIAW
ncbi:dihydroxyacetone kinase, DhaK subunit [Enterococcus phoeniculicola]|jgi:dihydroxyacetone kinase-like protein|uniref:phosphoenolpyruvate--glycerone phosphotransferase n=1 Tax=Enterococcus phoeniculicola ATCC BAA-412 TaxID=1158610 RepID=R3W4B4_9ENTE|nr:dihydroxyacetone kinase subunit DhaK [Enterococcus phoeniculicola]EOL42452.1 dihydroxyacetone kinase, DhaK subunit [Enterococcus phoeniculicola ATCC BAA-412]EOT79269.1 dihydroxyacetone kinase, DhaK subunit [Enterococcus phoeniculicola ATCC BAA-412]OJG73193.1 dihydroxyacetone kinase, DhaK subunit [Enterococcus phoeniculicola]